MLIGVEFGTASLNGVYANWDDFRKQVATVEQAIAQKIQDASQEVKRESAKNFVLEAIRSNKHMLNDRVSEMGERLNIREWRYVITPLGKESFNWRLMSVSDGPGR